MQTKEERNKRQSDLRFQKQNQICNRLKGDIQYIFRTAQKECYTHDRLLQEIKDRIWNDKGYIKLPANVKHGLTQYENALFDLIWAERVEWVHWYEGIFVHKNAPYGDGFSQYKLESAHVWKGTEIPYTERKFASVR